MGDFPVVLVVEDEWLIREAMVQALQESGWRVLEASSGEGAVAMLRSMDGDLHVLITDIQLSGYLSGWDVADAVRQTHPQTSIIYASGNSVDQRRRVPGSTFFEKPYTAIEVLHACRRVKG